MSEQNVVGLRPWLPGALGRSPWWNEPVRAERLAAFRIGMGACVVLDALAMYSATPKWSPPAGTGRTGAGRCCAASTTRR